jgi:hypothetical protein
MALSLHSSRLQEKAYEKDIKLRRGCRVFQWRTDYLKEGRPMKQFRCALSTFIVIMAMGALALLILALQQFAPAKTEGESEKFVASADFTRLSPAIDAIDRLKLDPEQPSALRADRERVEVLPRSITFPAVINQGEFLISGEFPNTAILCSVASYYAGRAQGLIWAMDRDTVVEHALHWTIDDAGDLFDTCLHVFLREAFADENVNDKNQLEDVKEVLAKQIQLIQKKLKYAQNVKFKTSAPSVGVSFKQPARHDVEGPCLSE